MEFRPLRRFKQAATPQECEELLISTERGILAVHGENGYPYGLPLASHSKEPVGADDLHQDTIAH